MSWRFSANHTHLYPGARLRSLDAPGEARLSPGDDVLVEFSDGVLASGRWLTVNTNTAVFQLSLYRSRSGTDVAPRLWRLIPTNEPGVMRVQKRIPVA